MNLKEIDSKAEYLGSGSDDNGREYDGYFIDNVCKYFYTDNGEEVIA